MNPVLLFLASAVLGRVGREATEASRQAINGADKQFEAIVFGDDVKVVHLDAQLLGRLDCHPGSLGLPNRPALDRDFFDGQSREVGARVTLLPRSGRWSTCRKP
jgi:hypothetical protein